MHITLRLFVLAGLCALALFPCRVWAEDDTAVMPIYPVAGPITVDGNLTDAEWGGDRLAWPIDIPEFGTVAVYWLRYDQHTLYGAFKVTDSSPAKNTRLMHDRWEGDQLEICLCTDPANHPQHSSFGDYDHQVFLGRDGEGAVNAYVNINDKLSGTLPVGSHVAITPWADGKGYNLEFSLPWASLNRPADFAPKTGLQIGWQVQVDLSTPDGERLAYTAKWWPHGIHFQHPNQWAWARFLAPGEERPAPPRPAAAIATSGSEVQFPTPTDGLVSVNITDDKGALVRRLVIGQHLNKGTNAALWDGKDDAGHAVPPGTYKLKGSVANLGVKYLTTLGNTSPEPYGGLRRSAGGEYRHGCWSDVITNPDGTFYVLNWGGEGPPALQQVDPKQHFRVIWGGTTTTSGNEFQEYGARDGNTLYFTHERRVGAAQRISTLSRMNAVTHKGERFTSGEWTVPLGEPRTGQWAPDADVCGLGAHGGKVYVPCRYENRVDVYDGTSGDKVGTITNPAFTGPMDIAFAADGTMFVVDKTSVYTYDTAQKCTGTITTGLTQGAAVTAEPTGGVYVTDAGTNQVKAFTLAGKPLKTIGPKGGAASTLAKYGIDGVGGKIHDDWFYHPAGLAFDAVGNLVVVDTGNLRIQVFNPAGKCVKSLLAAMYANLCIDPKHPETVFEFDAQGVMLAHHMNWQTGASRIDGEYTLNARASFVKFHHGTPYFFGGDCSVWTIDKGKARMRTALYRYAYPSYEQFAPVLENGKVVRKNYQQISGNKIPISLPWEFRDLNGDGLPQLSEYRCYTKEQARPWWGYNGGDFYVDDDWNMYLGNWNWQDGHSYVVKIPFQGFDKTGNPIYTWEKSEMKFSSANDPAWNSDNFKAPQMSGIHLGADGSVYLALNDRPGFEPLDNRLRKYNPDGTRAWSICHGTRGFWHKPGEELTWITDMGGPIDGLLVGIEETGSFEFFNPDGFYIGTALQPSDMTPDAYGTDVRYQPTGEQWAGQVFKHPKTGRVYIVAQPNAQPLLLLYEVTGTDKVQYFTGTCQLPAGGK